MPITSLADGGARSYGFSYTTSPHSDAYVGQSTHNWQAHAGPVDVNTTPKVQYAYADASDNTVRQTGLIHPNGRVGSTIPTTQQSNPGRNSRSPIKFP